MFKNCAWLQHFLYKLNRLSNTCLMKNIVKKQHVSGLAQSFWKSYDTREPYPFIKIHEKLYITICIFCVLIIFYIYQTIHIFPNKFKSLSSKFREYFLVWQCEDKEVPNIFFDAYFDRICVHIALNKILSIVFWSLVESIRVIKYMKEILLAEREIVFYAI